MHTPIDDLSSAQKPMIPYALRGLFALAVLYTLYFTSSLLIPIAFAMFLNIAFSPLVLRATRWHIPKPISAGFIVTALVGICVATLLVFAEPAEEWLSEAPKTVRDLKTELLSAKGRFSDIKELAEEVGELRDINSDSSAPAVTIQRPGVLENILGNLPVLFAGTGLTMLLTFFLLSSGDNFLRGLTRLGRNWSERRRIVRIVRTIEADLSRFLMTITCINLALGAAVALALQWLGVANPMLWGAMVCVLNFAPYFGALMSAGVLTIVGLTEFATIAQGLTVPAVFLVLTVLEGQILSPAILGRRMAISPVTIFISVMVWGWLWGVAGALMAVPIMTCLNVIMAHSENFHLIGQLLFGRNVRKPQHPEESAMANDSRSNI